MVTWIAGAPHNGSTFIRQIIKKCFGVMSYSRYYEEELDFLFPGGSAFSRAYLENEPIRLRWLKEHKKTVIIKTHEIPVDNSPAIFVVRDGRDAVTAVSNFWKIPIAYAITGQHIAFPSWSEYFWSWKPLERSNTLMVKFEDMVSDPNKVAQELSPFLGLEQTEVFVDAFEDNKKEFGQLFQDSGSCWQECMTDSDLDLFWNCHGNVMDLLGYKREADDATS